MCYHKDTAYVHHASARSYRSPLNGPSRCLTSRGMA
uniref:Uncharacterized protein n=1 Tax=Setaria italica TaxID=4555 RepID=K4A4D9_SETIT